MLVLFAHEIQIRIVHLLTTLEYKSYNYVLVYMNVDFKLGHKTNAILTTLLELSNYKVNRTKCDSLFLLGRNKIKLKEKSVNN